MAADSKIHFTMHLSDRSLDEAERDQQIRELFEKIQSLTGIEAPRYITGAATNGHRSGIEIAQLEADRLRPLLSLVANRLDKKPLETQVVLQVGTTHLQIQTRKSEEVLALLPLAERLLPKHLVYQGKAAAYARRTGFTPVERANLELLRYQLDLNPDEAQVIQAKALGPYETFEQRLGRYEQVLSEEIRRQYPLSDETEAELKRLQESLGLDYEDVAEIRDKHLSRAQSDQKQVDELKATITQLQTRITQLQQPIPEPEKPPEPPTRDRYRQEFQQVIQHTLYPNDFDRGRLEQCRRLWQLSTAEVQAIEQSVTDQLYGAITSSRGVDYRRLRQLLWSKQWQEADRETERVMLQAGSQDMRPLSSSLLNSFPCVDLVTVDGLWQRYSDRRYGFVAQRQIYTEQPTIQDFLRIVGWQDNWGWGGVLRISKAYSDLQFHEGAPKGHLPTWRWACTTLESIYAVGSAEIDAFFDRLNHCLPS
ncbi:GUN4 domain-containing protein [Almyronema epifaneia]|uniref:GUN4 domain-containing protein n=1 Tax=Almyronema epifaneia S1 TaxID=2991925 RepID=A0ABW6ILL6_9CYAN